MKREQNDPKHPDPKPEPSLDERFDRLEAGLAKLADYVGRTVKTQAEQAERIEELARSVVQADHATAERIAEGEAHASEPEWQPSRPPHGTIRFWSPYKQFGIWTKPPSYVQIGGKVMPDPDAKFIEFSNGLYETNDPAIIELLRGFREVGQHGPMVIEDPTAQPHPGVRLIDGPKTSASTQRAREELAARL